jgi:RNA polymerase II C-terminal domain phosphatase-like 3/4
VIFVSCNEKFLVADAAAEEEEKKRERKTGREKVEGKKKKRVEVRKKRFTSSFARCLASLPESSSWPDLSGTLCLDLSLVALPHRLSLVGRRREPRTSTSEQREKEKQRHKKTPFDRRSMASAASSDDDSADIAAALELELEGGSSDPEGGNDAGGDGASKRRRVEGKMNDGDDAAAADAAAAAGDADDARRPRPPPPRPVATCAHPATMGGICVVCGLHVVVSSADEAATEAEERQQRRQEQRQEERAAAAAAGGGGATTATTAATATTTTAYDDQDQDAAANEKDQVALRYIHAGLRVSAAEAARLREASDAASKAARRLHLVLDLDHTLLNSTRLDEIPRDTCGGAMDALIAAEDAKVAANGGEEENKNNGTDSEKPFPFQSLRAFPPHPSRSLFYLPAINLWTKLRPGTRAFLQKSSEKYELAVYTHGDRAYAAAMARLLDPTGELFGGRVISQGDSTRAHHKSLDVVLGSDLTTLILDDTRAVWPQHEGNLLLVDRYIFFPACAGRFFSLHVPTTTAAAAAVVPSGDASETTTTTPAPAPPPPPVERPLSWLEKSRDEDLSTGMLSVAARVLDAVHESYFKELDEEEREKKEREKSGGGDGSGVETKTRTPTTADVRKHLHALRSSILQGCVLVLSGMAPMGTPLDAVPAARTARALGATVEERLVPGRTTHVVAAADGTAKVKGARAHNVSTACAAAAAAAVTASSTDAATTAASPLISCVSPEWLSACLFGWERKDEALFPVAMAVTSSAAAMRTRTDAEDLAAAAAAAGRAG